jgi:iron complex outermembrane receptor protein
VRTGGRLHVGYARLKSLLRRFGIFIATVFLCAGPALAQMRAISISEQPLSMALREVGQQTGQNILFTPSSVEGLTAPAIHGQMNAQQAVEQLLRGTGLVAVADGRGLLIEKPLRTAERPPAEAMQPDTGSQGYFGLEQVIVSSTRITSNSFSAPTPTTVVTADQLMKMAQPSVFEAIIQLPALQGSTGPDVNTNATSTGQNGLSAFGLRGLGTIRTLVLLDGQRVVPANVTGVADISAFPQLLIQRVDVVTGGASASWGSDAVAGVINFVTEKKFTGFKANLLGGISTYGDDAGMTGQFAFGTAFDSGRGNIEISGEYSYSAGVHPRHGINGFGLGPGQGINGRDWNMGPGIQMPSIAATPPGRPQYIYGINAQSYQMAKFGLITAGPLQGTAFGSGGAPSNFLYGSNGVPLHDAEGTVAGCSNSICFGGDTSAAGYNGTTLADALTRGDIYSRVSYDLGRNVSVYATVNLATVWSLNTPNSVIGKNANLTIQCANPFVPASVMAQCANSGIGSFQYGTTNAEFPSFITVRALRNQRRFVAGADGAFPLFGNEWTWDSYFEHGQSDTSIHVRDISLTPRFNQAIDAVSGPGGAPVCRSPAAQQTGCAALNIIGDVPVSAAAIAYVIPANGPFQQTHERQEAFSLSANGSPFRTWAGLASMAAGIEYREEAYDVRGDPYGNGVTATNPNTGAYPADPVLNNAAGNNWYAGNFHDAAGNYHVSETFVEVAVPLLDNQALGRINLALAGRLTHYSTSGQIVTWKAGGTWDTPLDGVRVRALQSRDVRSPNLSELFAANVTTNAAVTNDFTGNNVTILNVAAGNSQLRPEKSQTTEIGLVLQPSWLEDFSASIDYYRIAVKDEISSLTAQQEVDLCFNGNAMVCSAIVTSNGGPPQTAPFSQVISKVFNLASAVTDGFEVEVNYRVPLSGRGLPGELNFRILANHTSKFLTDPGIPGQPVMESAGNMTLGAATASNVPLWKLWATQSYTLDRFNLTFAERWISDGVFNKMYIECRAACPAPTIYHPTINYNRQPGAFYFDLGSSYDVAPNAQLYFKIDNIANQAPAASPAISAQSYGINPALYDVVGRMFRLGVRVSG